MDIAELLLTGREERIANSMANLSSLFSSAISQVKSIRAKKIIHIKQRKHRKQGVVRRNISEDTTASDHKEVREYQAEESLKVQEASEEEGENQEFLASSNPANKYESSKTTCLCSASTTDKFSSSSNCLGIQEFLLPATASSSLAQNNNDFFSPSRFSRLDDPCTFEEDDILGLSARVSLAKKKSPYEQIELANAKGKSMTFSVFKEDQFDHKSSKKLMGRLVGDVTYDEDQSSDDGIVKDGLQKAKTFLIKNIKSFVTAAISTHFLPK